MARGYKTGGRQKGSKNKRTVESEAAAIEAAQMISAALGDDVFPGDAHTLLMAVYKNASYPINLRVEAARSAIKYEKPALASINHSGDITNRYVAEIPTVSADPDAWQQQHVPPQHRIQ